MSNVPTVSKPVSAAISGELMKNYIAGTSIATDKPLAVFEDRSGAPMLLSVGGTDTEGTDALYLMMRDTTAGTGWQQRSLSAGLAGTAICYAVSVGPDGTAVIAVAMQDDQGGCAVYVTGRLEPDPSWSGWQDPTALWTARPGGPTGTITSITAGEHVEITYEDDTVGVGPLLIATVQTDAGVARYFVVADPAQDGSQAPLWRPYHEPSQVSTLHDLQIGRMEIGGRARSGTYALYTSGDGSRWISFTSLPSPNPNTGHQTRSASWRAPDGATVLAPLPDPTGLTRLFVAGSGVWVYEPSDQGNAATAPTALPGGTTPIRALLARQDSQSAVVWTVDQSGQLWSTTSTSGGPWGIPMLVQHNVANITAWRNRGRSANELFLTTSAASSSTVRYLFQDAATRQWQHTDMPVPATAVVQEFPCFTTVVRFTDPDGNPVVGAPVTLNASTWCQVVVNGFYSTLDDTNPCPALTDGNGSVTIINKVSTLATPIFRFGATWLDAQINVNPAAAALSRLASSLSGSNLSDVTLPDGSKLVPPDSVDQDTLDQVQQALAALSSNQGSLPADGSAATVTPTTSLMVKPKRTLRLGVISDLGDAIWTAAGDLMQAITTGVEEITDWVLQTAENIAEDLLQFAVKVGEAIYTFLITTLTDLLSVINWICQKIAVGLETLIQWLGFLFDWDDIVTTHKVLVNLGKQSMLFVRDGVAVIKAKMDAAFARAIAAVESYSPTPPAVKPPAYLSTPVNKAASGAQQGAPASSQQMASFMTTHPAGTFATYQLSSGGALTAAPPAFPNLPPVLGTLLSTVITELKVALQTVEGLLEGVQDLYQTGELTLGNLLKLVSTDLLAGLLAAVQGLLDGVLEVAEDLIDEILDGVLLATADIPLISGLYAKFAGGDEMSILDGMCLLIAVPVTMAYKVLTGQAPFANGTYGLDTESWTAMRPLGGALHPSFAVRPLQLDETADSSETVLLYSQIGGAAAVLCDALVAIVFPIKCTAEVAERKDITKILAFILCAVYTVKLGGTFPLDDADGQEALDLVGWGADLLTLVLSAGDAINSVVPEDMRMVGVDKASSAMNIVDGAAWLVVGGVSYVAELVHDLEGDHPDYHGLWMDTVKLVSNVVGPLGPIGEGVFGLRPTGPAGWIGFALGVVGYTGGFIVDILRLGYTIQEDLRYQHH